MAAFVDRRTGATAAVGQAMREAFARHGVESNSLTLEVDRAGLQVSLDTAAVDLAP